MSKERGKIREVERVVGLLEAALSAVDMGKLYYKRLEVAKIQVLEREKGNFDGLMSISTAMRMDFQWWISHLSSQDKKCFVFSRYSHIC